MTTRLRLRALAQVPSSQSSLHSPLMCGTTEEPEVCLIGLFGLGFTAAGRGSTLLPGKLAPGIAGRLELAHGLSLFGLRGTAPAA